MSIGISDHRLELAATAESFLSNRSALELARAAHDGDQHDPLPANQWEELAELGWLGIHVATANGGSGGSLIDLGVVLEQLGRQLLPGAFLPTCLAAAVIERCGSETARHDLLPKLCDGSVVAAVGLGGDLARTSDRRVDGDAGAVLGAGLADVLLLRVGDDLVIVDRSAVDVSSRQNLDRTRPVATVGCASVPVRDARVLVDAAPLARRLAHLMAACEAVGVARACTEMAVAYAKERHQFGRPIGSFQAVKHHCADMLIATELATAASWSAAALGEGDDRSAALAAASAVVLAVEAATSCARTNIQVHGAVGFTWLSDAHLFLRRAVTLEAFIGPVASMCRDIVDLAGAVDWPHPAIDLPSTTELLRSEVRDFRSRYDSAPSDDRPALLADSGFALPHLAPPWGRSATPSEQIVIAEELDGVAGQTFDWITQTIVAVGTDDQIERWVRPALVGDVVWCQLFSEPSAGSDAAGITTRGRRTEGGWLVNGQKVWTTQAELATHGLATVRTDPDQPKHRGISMLMIDMHAPGVTVRPLHDLAGVHRFNEVFLDDVFVPDDDVIGDVDDGWAVARATLGGERQSISKSAGPLGADARLLLDVADPLPVEHVLDVGRLLATNLALDALGVRRVIRAIGGAPPGATGEISKLAAAEHAQEVHRLALVLSGADAAFTDGGSRERFEQFMFSRQHTIGGGTAEISRNQIGERILGLPREPSLR